MLLSRFSRVVGAVAAATTFMLCALPLRADPMPCDAKIDGESVVKDGKIEVTWYIDVVDCKRSKGEYEYVVRVEDHDDKIRDLLRTGSWTLRSTVEMFTKNDQLDGVSSRNFKELFGSNVTSCTCVGSDE